MTVVEVDEPNVGENVGDGLEIGSPEAQTQPTAEDDPTPALTEARDGLRRTGSRIANLRAAFERHTEHDVAYSPPQPTSTPSQLERISLRSKEQEAEIAKWKHRHDRELTGMIEDHELEIAKLKERHDTDLTKIIEDHELEIARLKESHAADIEKEEDLRQAYSEKCTELEEEIETLQHRLANQDTAWQLQMAEQCSLLQLEKNQAQDEARNLQRQFYELKKGISAATRIEHQVSDTTLAQEFTKFFHETQNWIVNSFRKVKIDASAEEMCTRLGGIAEGRHLDYLKPIFEHFDTSIKLAAFQATVASYMMEIFDDALLFGTPCEAEWQKGIRMAMKTLPDVLSPAVYNRWRAMTVGSLGQCKGDEMKRAVESASRSLSTKICNTLNVLTEAEGSEARITSLDAILKRAVSVSHLFRVQRPRYEFELPLPGATFDPSVMEDISVESDGWSAAQGIRCAVWPYVIKYGDEDGNNMEVSNMVVRSRVLRG